MPKQGEKRVPSRTFSSSSGRNDEPTVQRRSKRRGVSVFQRQLRKRKVWVEQYEEGKAQKRRDKRKVMRGYYKAIKSLNRERDHFFGQNSGRTDVWDSRLQRKNMKSNRNNRNNNNRNRNNSGNNNSGDNRNNNRQSTAIADWNTFFDSNNKNNNSNEKKESSSNTNRKFAHSNQSQNTNQKTKASSNNDRNNNRNKLRYNTLENAMAEGKAIIADKKAKQLQREHWKAEQKKREIRLEQNRNFRNKLIKAKTRKGQPNLNARMTLLVHKLEKQERNNSNKQKQKSKNDDSTQQPSNEDFDWSFLEE